jgi:zinc protease
VVGDVDFAHVKTVVRRTFGRIRARAVPARFNPVEPEPLGSKRVEVHLPAQLPMLAMTMPVPVWQPGKNDSEVAALAVATQILAGGYAARMQKELVDEQRLAFSAAAGYDPFSMGIDLWFAYGMLGPKQKPEAFEQGFWRLIRDMAKTSVDQATLAAAKRNMIASEVFAQDSLYLRAKEIGRMEVVGIGAAHRDDWLAAIRQVTAKDVQQVVARWLKPARATTGILIPEVKP